MIPGKKKDERKRVFALIDVDNYCHRNGHVAKSRKLSIRLVIKWFLRDVHNLRSMLPEPLVGFAFCFDCGNPERKKFYPAYKADRVRDAFYYSLKERIDEIRLSTLPQLGMKNIYYDEGYEADDQIAMCCVNRRREDHHVICSNDQDYYQLLRHFCVSVWDSRLKQLRTQEWLEDKYDMLLADWITANILSGDPGDCIPNVVGPKTAIKYVKDRLSHHSKAYKNIAKDIVGQRRNYDLMKLPNPRLPERDRVLLADPYDQERWNSLCGKLGYQDLQDHSYVHPDSTDLEEATRGRLGSGEG